MIPVTNALVKTCLDLRIQEKDDDAEVLEKALDVLRKQCARRIFKKHLKAYKEQLHALLSR
jgi:chaperonin cofactor prefoldin